MELFSASSSVRLVLQSHDELVDASVPIDSPRGVPSHVERFLEIESASLDQMASLVGSIKLKKRLPRSSMHCTTKTVSRRARLVARVWDRSLHWLIVGAIIMPHHRFSPSIVYFCGVKADRFNMQVLPRSMPRVRPRHCLQDRLLSKKNSVRPCVHEDGGRLSSSEHSPAPGNL
jgi:hypothetical protein